MFKKVLNFISAQIHQIYKEGLPALFGKIYTLILIVLALPVVLLVRILRPIILIRFGPLTSRRIGHFLCNTEMYLCEHDAGMHPPRTFDIFYYVLPICNYQVKKMWERTGKLHIFPFNRFTQVLDRVNRFLPFGKRHKISTSDIDIYGLRPRAKTYFSFTPEEKHLGQQYLRSLGIPDDALFVCFYARDSAYLEATYPNYNWRYHDYRDVDINNYIPAIEELVRQGYFAIRIGFKVKEPLSTANPRIIDYATNNRTDFLDIYLASRCKFFISSTGGIAAAPVIFKRPLVMTNLIPFNYILTANQDDLFIPKKLWLGEERRFLSFREIINSSILFHHSEKYKQQGIEPIENTPEEITAVVVEMNERLKGSWQTSKEDEQLQQRFWSLFKPGDLPKVITSRIGTEFLRQNQHLLK